MKIAFDAKRAFFNTTGLGNYSRSLIDGLLQLFSENQYFLCTTGTSGYYTPPKGANLVLPHNWFSRTLNFYWRFRGINSLLKSNKIDIFHGLSSELPLIHESLNVKKVVTVHDLIFLRYPHLYKSHDRYIYRKKTAYACRVADKIVAISDQTKQDLINFIKVPESKIEIIYQDCHPVFQSEVTFSQIQEVKRKLELPDKYILIVGTVEPRKNHLNILKALKTLPGSYQLIIAGKETKYSQELKKYIAGNNLKGQVRFLSYVSFTDLPALYKLATVFAYPSFFEGFGIPVLEALNAGVPVITSLGSCFKETGGEAALYVNPERPEDIAGAIERVYNDTELRKEMIQKGLKHALNFRKEVNLPKLIQLYTALL